MFVLATGTFTDPSKLGPCLEEVIAGHKNPEKDDSPRIIEETRQYIRDFDRVAETSTTARELYDKMLEFYPDRANPGSLWGSARAVKG